MLLHLQVPRREERESKVVQVVSFVSDDKSWISSVFLLAFSLILWDLIVAGYSARLVTFNGCHKDGILRNWGLCSCSVQLELPINSLSFSFNPSFFFVLSSLSHVFSTLLSSKSCPRPRYCT